MDSLNEDADQHRANLDPGSGSLSNQLNSQRRPLCIEPIEETCRVDIFADWKIQKSMKLFEEDVILLTFQCLSDPTSSILSPSLFSNSLVVEFFKSGATRSASCLVSGLMRVLGFSSVGFRQLFHSPAFYCTKNVLHVRCWLV
jgi:hypothetical protein